MFAAPGQSAADLDVALKTLSAEIEPILDPSATVERRDALRQALAARARGLLNAEKPDGLPDRRPFHWPIVFPEVFGAQAAAARGFDAIVGNPPFQGGQKITGALGTDYRAHLVHAIAGGRRGSADLCAYFFLRSGALLRDGGGFGLLATNTIAQGDTREVGLDQLGERGFVIQRALASEKWPGTANLEVAHVWVRRGVWVGDRVLENQKVPAITTFLTKPARVEGRPYRLAANDDKSFQGSIVLGMGFVLSPAEAQELIQRDPRNREVLFPYLNGEDLNSRPDQSPSRWVINFQDWPLERAETYPDCMRIVREKVKPERDRLADGNATDRDRARRWWQFGRPTIRLYSAIAGLARILAIPETTKYCCFSWSPTGIVLSHMVKVIATSDDAVGAVLSSSLHDAWARQYSSTLETRLKYITSDAFETFAFPADMGRLAEVGRSYLAVRREVLRARGLGLTDMYNLVHDSSIEDADIRRVRESQVSIDEQVAGCYGWSDVNLSHAFRATRPGVRFAIAEEAQQELLIRLLELNHERHAKEVEAGLHRVRSPRRSRAASSSHEDGRLF